jgi:hypothetical protein
MAAVYVNNLVINSGSDFAQSFTLQSSDTESSLDLTNYTVDAQLRKWSGSSTSVSFASSITNPPTLGKIYLTLTSAETVSIKPGRYVYDVVVTDNYSVKTRVVEGMVLVREGVTR